MHSEYRDALRVMRAAGYRARKAGRGGEVIEEMIRLVDALLARDLSLSGTKEDDCLVSVDFAADTLGISSGSMYKRARRGGDDVAVKFPDGRLGVRAGWLAAAAQQRLARQRLG